jgi:hypothetical protein
MIFCVLIDNLVRGVAICGTFACLGHSLINHVTIGKLIDLLLLGLPKVSSGRTSLVKVSNS